MYLDSIASAGANGFLSLCSAFFSAILNWGAASTASDLFFSFYFARMADLVFASFYRYSAFLLVLLFCRAAVFSSSPTA